MDKGTELKGIIGHVNKETNPSEALEQIKTLRTVNRREFDNDESVNKSLDILEQVLLKTEKLKKAWEVVKEHLIFEERGIETYANKTKYIVRLESKDTGATIHIHLDTQQELELIEEMSK